MAATSRKPGNVKAVSRVNTRRQRPSKGSTERSSRRPARARRRGTRRATERADLEAHVGEPERRDAAAAGHAERAVRRGRDAQGFPQDEPGLPARSAARRALRRAKWTNACGAPVVPRRRRGGGGGGEGEVRVGVRRRPGGLDAAAPDQADLVLQEVGEVPAATPASKPPRLTCVVTRSPAAAAVVSPRRSGGCAPPAARRSHGLGSGLGGRSERERERGEDQSETGTPTKRTGAKCELCV